MKTVADICCMLKLIESNKIHTAIQMGIYEIGIEHFRWCCWCIKFQNIFRCHHWHSHGHHISLVFIWWFVIIFFFHFFLFCSCFMFYFVCSLNIIMFYNILSSIFIFCCYTIICAVFLVSFFRILNHLF